MPDLPLKKEPPGQATRFFSRENLLTALVGTALAAMVFGILGSFATTNAAVGAVPLAFPVILGVAIGYLPAVFRTLKQKLRFPLVVTVTAAAILAYIGLSIWAATALITLIPQPLPVYFTFGLAAVAAVLAWAIYKLGSTRRRKVFAFPQNSDKPADDDAWLAQVEAALRARVDLSDQRVDQLIADARAQTKDSEHSLQERLGSPRLFARKVGPEPGVKPRREMLLYSVIAVGFIISLTTNLRSGELGGNSLTILFALWGVSAAFLLLNAAWRWRREIKTARDKTPAPVIQSVGGLWQSELRELPRRCSSVRHPQSQHASPQRTSRQNKRAQHAPVS